jgi:RimJ/RimL family protein N-acetyltransferase
MTFTPTFLIQAFTSSNQENRSTCVRPVSWREISLPRPIFGRLKIKKPIGSSGRIYFKHIEPHHLMTWELGYILNPHYHRQGYMSEAVAALVQHGFDHAAIHRVVAHCNPENTSSWKLLEKIGFRREGLLRQNIFFRQDALGEPIWTDTYVYALLASETNR